MTTARSIVCGACGSDVPYGRLSCPACGELLASVAGGIRRATEPRVGGTAIAPSASRVGGERIMPESLHDAAAAAPPEPTSAPELTYAPEPTYGPGPGAYVPPPSVDQGPPVMVAGPAAPARAWAGLAAPEREEAAAGAGYMGRNAGGRPASDAGNALTRRTEFIGWLTIAGGALAAVGFLLPWGLSMIGATGTDYVDRWGIAGPFHPLVALAVIAVVAGAIVPNRIPEGYRVGLAGTILGAYVLGLAWPYLLGFSRPGPGAVAVTVGAALLLAAGVVSLVMDRHATSAPPV